MSYTHYSVCLAELMRGIGIATPTHGYKPEQAFVDGKKIADKITQLQAEVEALRKDAARYQWLRRMSVGLSLSHQVISQFVTNQGELDAVIAKDTQEAA